MSDITSTRRTESALLGAVSITLLSVLVVANIPLFDGFLSDIAWGFRFAWTMFLVSLIGFMFVPWEAKPLLRRLGSYVLVPAATGLLFYGVTQLRSAMSSPGEEMEMCLFLANAVLPWGQVMFIPMAVIIFLISRRHRA
ncbi:MAG: hypothetical protein V4681_00835 [Patescibacteria group bacterium]